MKSLNELLSLEIIEQLSLPSNLRYGHAIFARGGIEIIKLTPKKAVAWVGGLSGSSAEGGGQRRRIQIIVTTDGLKWHCAGNPKNHQIFCKHCVALALFLLEKG